MSDPIVSDAEDLEDLAVHSVTVHPMPISRAFRASWGAFRGRVRAWCRFLARVWSMP